MSQSVLRLLDKVEMDKQNKLLGDALYCIGSVGTVVLVYGFHSLLVA